MCFSDVLALFVHFIVPDYNGSAQITRAYAEVCDL